MTLTAATTPGQSRPGNNGFEGKLHIAQSYKTEIHPQLV